MSSGWIAFWLLVGLGAAGVVAAVIYLIRNALVG
jgi:hypothetical protein